MSRPNLQFIIVLNHFFLPMAIFVTFLFLQISPNLEVYSSSDKILDERFTVGYESVQYPLRHFNPTFRYSCFSVAVLLILKQAIEGFLYSVWFS